jgi:hypothetical protein
MGLHDRKSEISSPPHRQISSCSSKSPVSWPSSGTPVRSNSWVDRRVVLLRQLERRFTMPSTAPPRCDGGCHRVLTPEVPPGAHIYLQQVAGKVDTSLSGDSVATASHCLFAVSSRGTSVQQSVLFMARRTPSIGHFASPPSMCATS